MSSSVKPSIFYNPDLEQTGETHCKNGSRFSVITRLKGRHTISDLRTLVSRELIEPIMSDMQKSEFDHFGIDVDGINFDPNCIDRLWQTEWAQRMFTGANVSFIDQRNLPGYNAELLHVHDNAFCRVLMCIGSGCRETDFVYEEAQLLRSLRHQAHLLPVPTQIKLEKAIADAEPTVSEKTKAACQTLFIEHDSKKDYRPALQLQQQRARQQCAGILSRPAKLGSINVFKRTVKHGAGQFTTADTNNPGVLFTEGFSPQKYWRN